METQPSEIIKLILQKLTLKELISCQRVCKYFLNLSKKLIVSYRINNNEFFTFFSTLFYGSSDFFTIRRRKLGYLSNLYQSWDVVSISELGNFQTNFVRKLQATIEHRDTPSSDLTWYNLNSKPVQRGVANMIWILFCNQAHNLSTLEQCKKFKTLLYKLEKWNCLEKIVVQLTQLCISCSAVEFLLLLAQNTHLSNYEKILDTIPHEIENQLEYFTAFGKKRKRAQVTEPEEYKSWSFRLYVMLELNNRGITPVKPTALASYLFAQTARPPPDLLSMIGKLFQWPASVFGDFLSATSRLGKVK